MKKFLTVLLALSVVFTYTVGTAFAAAPTNEDDFGKAVAAYKGSLTYDGNGYLKTHDGLHEGWVNIISKTVLESAIDEWADAVDLTTVDYVSNAVLTDGAKRAMFEAIAKEVKRNQYNTNLAAWNELVADIDLSMYNAAGRTNIQNAIENGENAIVDDNGGVYPPFTLGATKEIADLIDGLKATVKANENNLLTEVSKDLAETVASLEKTLDDASYEYYAFAKEWFEEHNVTKADEVAAKSTFDADYNALVAYFEECIERYEAETIADDGVFTTSTRLTEVINYFFAANADVNAPVKTKGYFQKAIDFLNQEDVWTAYYEKAATEAKAELNVDGTKKYYDVDVEKLLADTKDALANDLWAAFNAGNFGSSAANVWKGLKDLANNTYDLQAYRKAAIDKFTTDYGTEYYDCDAHWFGNRADKVAAIQDEYTEKVLLATTVEEIDALVKEAKAAIDKIMTAAEVKAVADKVASRIKAAGYLTTVTIANDGKATVATATGDGFASYFDVVVGSSTTYKAAIKEAALKAAAQVFVDAVIAEENDSITYKQIDEIIAANKDAAYAALKDVKTTAELKDEAAAVTELIKALPTTITIADKEQVLAAQTAMDAYMENAGAKQTDVSKYATLKAALDKIINAEKRDVEKLIRALPATVTIDDAAKIVEARAAYDAFEAAYSDYIGTVFTTATMPNDDKLVTAENKLEDAKLAYTAKLINALDADSTNAEIEAAKAAFDAMDTKHKLMLNDELYNKLMNAVAKIALNDIKAVESLKVVKNHSVAGKGYIKIAWSVKGDAAAADGYQIYRATKANGKYTKFFTTSKMTYKNTKSLKKGTKYFYKVRAYKTVDGVKYYSDWSNKAYRVAK